LSSILKITSPLGISWNPISKKGHDFQSSFNYVGFCCEIPSRAVSLSSKKHLHLPAKVTALLSSLPPCMNNKIVASIHGSLQHITIVYLQGQSQSHLAPLSSILSKFPNDHILHNIPKPCTNILSWWATTLVLPNPTCTLMPPPKSDLHLCVDASTSWGLGFCVGDKWAAWRLLDGCAQDGRDIVWDETVEIELVVLWLVQSGWHDHYFRVNCDSTTVIAYFWKGCSRKPAHNSSLGRTSSCLAA